MSMPTKRRKVITELLRTGGAVHRDRCGPYTLHHPEESMHLREEEVRELLHEGLLAVIACNSEGFWWALRPDLVAEYSL